MCVEVNVFGFFLCLFLGMKIEDFKCVKCYCVVVKDVGMLLMVLVQNDDGFVQIGDIGKCILLLFDE